MDPEWDSRHYLFHSRFLPFCQPGRNWQVSIDPKLNLYLALRKARVFNVTICFQEKRHHRSLQQKLRIVSRHFFVGIILNWRVTWRKLHVNKTNITRTGITRRCICFSSFHSPGQISSATPLPAEDFHPKWWFVVRESFPSPRNIQVLELPRNLPRIGFWDQPNR